MLNYNHLYYFHVVATEGSFASAAQKLGLTQPTISEQVKALERALGVSLFDRQPAGVRLTEEGRIAYEHTTAMFRAGENLRQALGQESATVPQVLRIGISGAVGRSTTTKFLLPLLSLPECVPSIRSGDTTELVREVRAAELDLAVVETEPSAGTRRGLEVVQLDTIELVAVTSAGTESSPVSWGELGLVNYRASSAFRIDVDAFLESRALRPPLVAEADDALFLLEAAARGGYVSFVPRSVARDALKSGRLRELGAVKSMHAGVFAVFPDSTGAELARNAVQLLLDQARDARTST